MYNIVIILSIIAGILMIIVVLAQNPKGGGLTSGFTGVNQLLGAKSGTNLFEKLTWGTAIFLVAMSLFSASLLGSGKKNTIDTPKSMNDEGVLKGLKGGNTKFNPNTPTPAPTPNTDAAKKED